MTLNVNSELEDVFYRYKMPRLLAKVEGKGNGIKTVVVNMSEIAKALYRKPSYSTKYFGFELGAQINLDEKNDRYVVNGCHDANKLQGLLQSFIKKFVLCQVCGNPETSLISKKNSLFYKCKACGFSDQMDSSHRLTQYILKNPPETEAEGAFLDIPSKIETIDHGFDNTWVDESPKFDDETFLQELSINDNSKLTNEQQRATDFHEFVESLFNKREIISQRKSIEKKVNELGIGPGFILILMEVVFCNRDTVFEDVDLYKILFQHFTRRGSKKCKVQECVLLGMEKLLVSMNIVAKSCHFLKALYDSDIVEEECIVKWFHKGV